MRIAVISDTHNHVPPGFTESIAGADVIWHLGDVCDESVAGMFARIGPPLKVVRGNCDACLDWPLTLDFECEGFQIRLVHIPPRQAPPGFDLLFHGHTHVPRNELVGATRFCNPGAVSKANKG